jgi:hypothetical protein
MNITLSLVNMNIPSHLGDACTAKTTVPQWSAHKWTGHHLRASTTVAHQLTLQLERQLHKSHTPVSGRDSDSTISGEPLQYTWNCDAPRVLVMTLIRCRFDENGNWRTMPISSGGCNTHSGSVITCHSSGNSRGWNGSVENGKNLMSS